MTGILNFEVESIMENLSMDPGIDLTTAFLAQVSFAWCFPFCAMKCLGLAKLWENSEELRNRIRDEKRVLVYADTDKYCKPNRVNAISNACVVRYVQFWFALDTPMAISYHTLMT